VVAELLRLRLRILANGFRRRPLHVLAIVVGLLVALAGVVLFWAGAAWVSRFDDEFVMRATTTVGAWLSIAALLLPLMIVRHSVLSPRAFLGYPISPLGVCLTMLLYSVIGPGILLLPMAFAPVTAWPDEASQQVAWAAAPLLFLQSLLTIRLARHLGVVLRRHPRIAAWVDFLGTVVLLLGGVVAVVVVAARVPELVWLVKLMRPFNAFFRQVPEVIADTPFGLLWAAPGYASTTVGDPDTAWRVLGLSALLVVALLVVWIGVIGAPLRATRRQPGPRRTRVPGWFARFPTSPAGAIAARSVTYWLRDPRYRAVYAVLPLVLAVMLLALSIGGVPFSIAVLVPLPVMTLLLGWSTIHNDVAYDNTAVWQHIAAQTRGSDDRRGRAVPVLLWGIVLLALGIPLTVWGHGDIRIMLPLAGVCIALLLGGVGVGSLYSARFPYAAPRPGDPAWQSPQSATSQGGIAQGISVLLVLLVAAPSLLLATMWWIDGGGMWGWLTLAAGIVAGGAMLAIGIRGGGRTFDARGPELLAFTLRN
jgi:ABC-2 type transport system permease protein